MALRHDGGAYDQLMQDGARRAQLWRTLDCFTAAARTELGNIQIYDARSGSLRIVAQRGFEREFLDYFDVVKADDGSACARALSEQQVFVPDVNIDEAYAPHRAIAERAGYRAVMSATIKGTNGIAGMLSFHFHAPREPLPRDRAVASRYARLLAPLLEGNGHPDIADEVRLAFVEAIQVIERHDAVARARGEQFMLELTPALELSVRRFAHSQRDAGARAEAMLVDLKQALSERTVPRHGELRREAYDAAIALAIRVFYDGDGG